MLSVSGETQAGLILYRAGEVEESDILDSGEWCAGPVSGQTCSVKPGSAMRPWALQDFLELVLSAPGPCVG